LTDKHLHIISFDVPDPPNYGGVIDVFYKIKALHAAGVKIHLHCFEYGRAEARVLESFTENVYYYKRQMSKTLLMHHLPYIVVTRRSEKLMEHLLRDNYPILFEGLHSCYHLADPRLRDRRKLVRTHNIEHTYYQSLARVERKLFRKSYFRMEARKLKHFEQVLGLANYVLAISRPDELELKQRYAHVVHVSAFHPNEKVSIREGKGSFALYHGNLEVGENNQAALYLVEKVFRECTVPLYIAGKNPSAELKAACAGNKHVRLLANIPTLEIDELIREAQINILPTFQATGIKLKLLAALFNGRYCIANTPMVANTGLESLCTVADSPEAMRAAVEELFRKPFDMEEKSRREQSLCHAFSNKESVNKLLPLI
jgi:glycosyltransferase involved in cell wall biosynthesis